MSPEDPSDAIFADPQVLSASYRPDRLEYRDDEIAALRAVLSPAIVSSGTACALVCGQPAQGKRTAVALACEASESRPGGTELGLVPVECPTDATAYKLAITATNTLRDGEALAESGYTRETAFRRLRGRIRDADETPVFRFDHVQRVDPAEFEVLLAGFLDATGDLPCGIVAVADGLPYRNALAVGTRRRLDAELFFSPYDSTQRRSIVEGRLSAAFHRDTCPDAVVDRCLAYAESTEDPLRTALEVLLLAGDEAARAGAATLTPEHVEQALTDVERDRVTERLEACSLHERRTLAAIASVEDGRFESVYDDYRRRCREEEVSPNRERSVHNYLDTLVDADLVEATEGRSSAGGRYFEYSLRPDAALVKDALTKLGELDSDGGAMGSDGEAGTAE